MNNGIIASIHARQPKINFAIQLIKSFRCWIIFETNHKNMSFGKKNIFHEIKINRPVSHCVKIYTQAGREGI